MFVTLSLISTLLFQMKLTKEKRKENTHPYMKNWIWSWKKDFSKRRYYFSFLMIVIVHIQIYKLSGSTSTLCSHVPNNLHSAIHFMLPLIPLFWLHNSVETLFGCILPNWPNNFKPRTVLCTHICTKNCRFRKWEQNTLVVREFELRVM